MADTYYAYQDTLCKIVHRLFKMDGWKVYGYHADNSDAMTDYWDPEYWNGIAEKNGYVFVCNHSTAEGLVMGKRYVENPFTEDAKIAQKIRKLEEITQERGASEQEEQTAKASIEKLMQKSAGNKTQAEKTAEEYVERPAHMANPPRCNWHVEKDGMIILKGTGLLKFAHVPDITNKRDQEDWQDFNNLTKEQWVEKQAKDYVYRWGGDLEREKKYYESQYESEKEKYALLEKFNEFISSVDSVCGSQVGEPEYEYRKVKVTEYKKENKAHETSKGELKAGQYFIIKGSFNYGIRKGLVYKIDSVSDSTISRRFVRAYKMNGKLTKMCTGYADKSNSFWCEADKFMKWIEKGAIAWCEIVEEKIPYEVEKVQKVPLKKADADSNNGNAKSKGESEMPKKNNAQENTTNNATTETKENEAMNAEQKSENPNEGFKMQDGTREGATEVYFDEKPDEAVRNRLKELKMRWHRQKKCWYGFADREDIKKAIVAA